MAVKEEPEQVAEAGDTDSDKSTRLNQLLMLEALFLWGMTFYFAFTQSIPWAKFTTITIGGSIAIYVTDELAEGVNSTVERVALLASAAIGIVFTAYLWNNYIVLSRIRIGYALPYEYVLGGLFILVLIYLMYRKWGMGIPAVLVAALLYGFAGTNLPGFLAHGSITWQRMIRVLTLEFQGFFGFISQIVAAWVLLFLLFAGLLDAYGIFDILIRGAFRAAEYIRSGVAQSGVVASMGMGMVNGTATANAAMTGSVTIPVMKTSRLRGETAGAVEAVASSGGQIMPPIMGAAAFIMASLLGTSYFSIIVAGLIPALVYYISTAVAVHFTTINQLDDFDFDASKHVEGHLSRVELGLQILKFGVPFIALLVLLGILQYTVLSAALYTVVILIACAAVIQIVEGILKGWSYRKIGTSFMSDTFSGLKRAAILTAPLVLIVAGINGIVDIISITGLAAKFALALMTIASGSLLLAAVLAMIVCIILGMGMPTVAAYTFVALLIAPAIIRVFAVPAIAAHFFVFYAAILSAITPPVAVAVVVTSGIADSNFWKTAWEAIKLSLPLFVLPFTFLFRPVIVTGGLSFTALIIGVITLAGAFLIAMGLNSKLSFLPHIDGSLAEIPARFGIVAIGVVVMAYPI